MAGPADEGGVFESFFLEQHSPTLRLTSDSNKARVVATEAVTGGTNRSSVPSEIIPTI